jgi:hypothetical protein
MSPRFTRVRRPGPATSFIAARGGRPRARPGRVGSARLAADRSTGTRPTRRRAGGRPRRWAPAGRSDSTEARGRAARRPPHSRRCGEPVAGARGSRPARAGAPPRRRRWSPARGAPPGRHAEHATRARAPGPARLPPAVFGSPEPRVIQRRTPRSRTTAAPCGIRYRPVGAPLEHKEARNRALVERSRGPLEPIGAPRFELGTSPTRTVRATRLRHAPSGPS